MVPPRDKPIKRHKAIQPLSREHHQGLLLCWKIRKGFETGVEPQRIKKYTDWFWENQLQEHFRIEEKYVFPVLSAQDVLVKQALEEHEHLAALFCQDTEISFALEMIKNDLEGHIRFEERVLFNKIQEEASAEELQHIQEHHEKEISCGLWEDEFWK
ncbi:hemerythrin domain-containing protein [Salegentibacter sp. Hel_I_6]|uniref:hemerythrin domain-containing protein n=1 Tax=Salegentibacter sp. Hel_I_6 TaxID=1250278 RepID=UPI00056615AE|nr:hemerythrin domain-containing protein [Salegentibacter sp. Hel_I_6]